MNETPIAEPPRRRRRVLYVVGVLAVALAATVLTVVATRGDESRPKPVAAGPRLAELDPTPPHPSAIPSTPTPRPRVPHEYVPAAVPTAFTLAGKHFRIHAQVCAMAPVFPLDPPGDQHNTVCWVTKGFGFEPGSRSGTSYVLGHSWAPDPLEVLNKASTRATRDILRAKPELLDGERIYRAKSLVGSHITLRTPRGTLVYEVRLAFGTAKSDLGGIDRIMDQHIRRRVVLITCAELNGVDYDYNVVLDARLVSSKRS
jgi:hypothetical protein